MLSGSGRTYDSDMRPAKVQPRIVFQAESGSPIGRIVLAGLLKNHAGIPELPMRVLGHYALVYLLRGHGTFRSADGNRRKLVAGDFFLCFQRFPIGMAPPPARPGTSFTSSFPARSLTSGGQEACWIPRIRRATSNPSPTGCAAWRNPSSQKPTRCNKSARCNIC